MNVVFLKPLAGKRCPYPAPGAGRIRWLPSEGAKVRMDSYWERRVADGTVELATVPPPEAPTPTPGPTPTPATEG